MKNTVQPQQTSTAQQASKATKATLLKLKSSVAAVGMGCVS